MTITDPGYVLQAAIVSELKSNGGVSAIVGSRVFDRVARNPDGSPQADFPYVALGDTQFIPDEAECTDAGETNLTLHCWSRAVGFPEVRRLAAAVANALHDVSLPLDSGNVQSLLLQSSRVLRDPDGLTSHAVLNFSVLTDAT